jgi:geranylgeranyl diphosphate synthase type 3
LLQLSDQLACYFQVRDDLINLASPSYHASKGFCEDLSEGKLSFVIIHALKHSSDPTSLRTLLKARTQDEVALKQGLRGIVDAGSIAYALDYLERLSGEIHKTIELLGGNAMLLALFTTMARDVEDCHHVEQRVLNF